MLQINIEVALNLQEIGKCICVHMYMKMREGETGSGTDS